MQSPIISVFRYTIRIKYQFQILIPDIIQILIVQAGSAKYFHFKIQLLFLENKEEFYFL